MDNIANKNKDNDAEVDDKAASVENLDDQSTLDSLTTDKVGSMINDTLIAVESKINHIIAKAINSVVHTLHKDADNARHLKRQIEDVMKVLEIKSNDWDDKTAEHIKQLQAVTVQLNEENFVLRKLPDKVKESLRAIVPDIAKEIDNIHKDILNNFNENIKICNDNLHTLSGNSLTQIEKTAVTAESSMDRLILKAKELSGNHLKKTFTNIVTIVVISTLISIASSYLIVTKLPTKVTIHQTSGDVHIEKSDVGIWSRDYKITEKYNYKQK